MGNLRGNGQAKAAARACIGLRKTGHDHRVIGLGNANTIILQLEDSHIALRPRAEPDMRDIRATMNHRIGHQVQQRLLHHHLIGADHERRVRQFKVHVHAAIGRLRLKPLGGAVDQRPQVLNPRRLCNIRAFRPLKGQKLVGQVARRARSAHKLCATRFRGLRVRRAFDGFGEGQNAGNRVAHLMGGVRDEFILRADAALHPVEQTVECRHDPPSLCGNVAPDRLKLAGGAFRNGFFQIHKRAQPEPDPEPHNQRDRGQKQADERDGPRRDLPHEGRADLPILPDRDGEQARDIVNCRGVLKAQHPDLAALIGAIVIKRGRGLGQDTAGRGRGCGVTCHEGPIRGIDMIKQLASRCAADQLPRDGAERITVRNRDIARDRKRGGQKPPVKDTSGACLRVAKLPTGSGHCDEQKRCQNDDDQPRAQRLGLHDLVCPLKIR